jgi:chromosomal replication initiation ATPase DnaA
MSQNTEIVNKIGNTTCEDCGTTVGREVSWTLSDPMCEPCAKAAIEKSDNEAAERRRFEWIYTSLVKFKDATPERIYNSDESRHDFNAKLAFSVEKWVPTEDKPWLGIVGAKGSCKSRVAIQRTIREIETGEGPNSPLFVATYDFAEAYQFRFNDQSGDSQKLLKVCRKSDWLILDDIGKARATPAVVAGLFGLLDHRHSHNLTTIWTSNSTPEEFCEGMPADTAGPMVRRLKETSILLAVR